MERVVAFLSFLIAVAVVASCTWQPPQPQGSTVVLVVRHADKVSDAEDSLLNETGSRRAQALAAAAADAGVCAIYTTQFKRNHDTAHPLSERIGVAATEVPVNLQNPGDYGQRLARDILEKHKGKTVLVVGHANKYFMPLQEYNSGSPMHEQAGPI